jgi:penicillin-binding protein 2
MTEGKIPVRLKALAFLCTLMFAALATRLWFMQVLAAEQYRKAANQNSVRLVYEQAPRGRIFDRHGNLLVGNRESLVVTVNRQELGQKDLEKVLFRLSKLLGIPATKLGARLEDPRYYQFTPVPIAFDVPKRVVLFIEEHSDHFPGVQTQLVPVRTYPEGKLATQLLGYVGEISSDQLKQAGYKKRHYRQGQIVGKSGVEQTYEWWLQGREGEQKLRVNSRGRQIGSIGERLPRPGDDLELSVDERVQRLAEQSLHLGMRAARSVVDEETGQYLRADAGAVIVMDPKTGEILALASAPTYDPNVFLDGITSAEWKRLNAPVNRYPLLDRTVQADYPPGSTFKPFVALSALHRGFASPYGSYDCPPSYTAPGDQSGTVFNNWSSTNYGYISLAEALIISCDTVFYQFGWDFWVQYFHTDPHQELLQKDLRSFGFDRPTGVDLPSEHSARIPDAEWKAQIHKENPSAFPYGDWLPGDYINMSIGQGDALVTPLQLAVAYSAIANGGTVWAPRVGLEIKRPDGKVVRVVHPHKQGRLPFTQEQLAYVRNALAYVPQTGTAAVSFAGFPFDQVPVAGKTGTAEVKPHQPDSWFAAMVPAGDPKYVVVAMVEQGGHGSTTAAPIVRRIIEGLYGLPHAVLRIGSVQD